MTDLELQIIGNVNRVFKIEKAISDKLEGFKGITKYERLHIAAEINKAMVIETALLADFNTEYPQPLEKIAMILDNLKVYKGV